MRTTTGILVAFCALILMTQVCRASTPTMFQVGRVKVWSILDASGETDVVTIFPGAADIVEEHIPGGKSTSSILAFLFSIDGSYILADSGLGSTTGPRTSRLIENLAKLGVKPEHIEVIALTHMHGDHVGGLIDGGDRVFRNARLKVSRLEHDYWLSGENREKNPARRVNFDLAASVIEAYGEDVELLDFGQAVAPGLIARDLAGHTPGHIGLYLESDGHKLLCVADMVHEAKLQFSRPDMSPRYDLDPERAALVRGNVMKLVAREHMPIAGMHLPYPGIGWVDDNGDGSFTFIPLLF